jgi:H+/Cl- antiporter ClcA
MWKRRNTIDEHEQHIWAKDVFQINKSFQPGGGAGNSKGFKHFQSSFRVLLMLFTLGAVGGLFNGLIMWGNHALGYAQVKVIALDPDHGFKGLALFSLSCGACVFAASCLCKYLSPVATGTGFPEFKFLISSDVNDADLERLLNWRVLLAKGLGLVLSVGSSLSAGSEGPLVHITACLAYQIMKYVGEFGVILDSPSLIKQILAASAAVGVSSAFNAPVGGLLFSIEITATFYLVSNYWKSFVAAVAGSVACNIFLLSKGQLNDPTTLIKMTISSRPFVKWELIPFLCIGIVFGILARFFLYCNQKVCTLLH